MSLHTHSCFACCSQNGVLWFIPCAAIASSYLTYAAVCFLNIHSGISHLFAREMGANYSITSSKFLLFNLYREAPILHFLYVLFYKISLKIFQNEDLAVYAPKLHQHSRLLCWQQPCKHNRLIGNNRQNKRVRRSEERHTRTF